MIFNHGLLVNFGNFLVSVFPISVSINCKMKEYINKVSGCSTFNDISDHFPLILFYKKDDSEGFHVPTPFRRFKWSQYMYML